MSKLQTCKLRVIYRLTLLLFCFLLIVSAAWRVLATNHHSFSSTDDFVLFASDGITLQSGTQISSGLLGTNGEILAQRNVLVSSDILADEVKLAAGVQVNGNISYNELDAHRKAVIFGETTTPITIPIVELPEIPEFESGTEDKSFSGSDNVLVAGRYGDIKLKKNSRLTLSGGTYNLNSLKLQKNSTLISAAPSILNIEDELTVLRKVAILPGADLKPDGLIINYKEDEIHFGMDSFLNLKLLAPQAEVVLAKEVTLRGQVLAETIIVGKESTLSRAATFEKESDSAKIVADVDGVQFIGNELLVLLEDGATSADAQAIATLVEGMITGFDPDPPIYKIELSTDDVQSMKNAIDLIKDSDIRLVKTAIPNLVGPLF